jgi:hypothetical protein
MGRLEGGSRLGVASRCFVAIDPSRGLICSTTSVDWIGTNADGMRPGEVGSHVGYHGISMNPCPSLKLSVTRHGNVRCGFFPSLNVLLRSKCEVKKVTRKIQRRNATTYKGSSQGGVSDVPCGTHAQRLRSRTGHLRHI